MKHHRSRSEGSQMKTDRLAPLSGNSSGLYDIKTGFGMRTEEGRIMNLVCRYLLDVQYAVPLSPEARISTLKSLTANTAFLPGCIAGSNLCWIDMRQKYFSPSLRVTVILALQLVDCQFSHARFKPVATPLIHVL